MRYLPIVRSAVMELALEQQAGKYLTTDQIISRLKERFGQSYRKKDLLEDVRLYRDVEKKHGALRHTRLAFREGHFILLVLQAFVPDQYVEDVLVSMERNTARAVEHLREIRASEGYPGKLYYRLDVYEGTRAEVERHYRMEQMKPDFHQAWIINSVRHLELLSTLTSIGDLDPRLIRNRWGVIRDAVPSPSWREIMREVEK